MLFKLRNKYLEMRNLPIEQEAPTWKADMSLAEFPKEFTIFLFQFAIIYFLFALGKTFVDWKLKQNNSIPWKVALWGSFFVSYIIKFVGNIINILVAFVVSSQMKLVVPLNIILPVAYSIFTLSTSCPWILHIQYLISIILFSFQFAISMGPFGEWIVLIVFVGMIIFLVGQIFTMNYSSLFALIAYIVYLIPSVFTRNSLPSETLICVYFIILTSWNVVSGIVKSITETITEKKELKQIIEQEKEQKNINNDNDDNDTDEKTKPKQD